MPGLFRLTSSVGALVVATAGALHAQATLHRSPSFTVTDTSVRQGRFEAVALSRDTIVSSYPRAAREVHFKFSINGLESEFRPGTDHTINVRPLQGRIVTPAYPFGVEQATHRPTPEESVGGEEGTAQITFRVDMREVLRSFRERGYYDPPNAPRLQRGEMKALYVIGDVEPLTWDMASLRPGSPLELTDPDSDGVYTVTLPVASSYTRPLAADGRALWARSLDVSAFPQLTSTLRMHDALYRLSLEELRQLVRDDGALSAGAKWPGVWTRDVSLSSVLALALVAPDAVRVSLMAKVDSSGRIIQDTGTGGSWPVSSDRMTWAMAAWELYSATGDRAWLRKAYDIIARSAEADLHAVRDSSTGLFRGESSFLDWREQSYPRWMDPKDIYQGEALGTNAVHHAAYRILADMSRALGEPAAVSARWTTIADGIRAGMTAKLWQPQRGWYGQFRYGRNYASLSPRAEALGEALTVIYGAAPALQQRRLSAAGPQVEFGTPTIWPTIPNEPFYHNGTIWPFVTAYSTWAAADAGNTAAVEHGLADMTRSAALFLTNKENMVASTGHFEGTALNSDRQLWSVAGTLASTYRLLLGIRLRPEAMALRPMVPPAYAGERTLRGLRYRGATLTITQRGFGDGARRVTLDGRVLPRAELPATLTGAHAVTIEMNGRWPKATINLVASRVAPATPRAELHGDTLRWAPVDSAARYAVYRNGRPWRTVTAARALVTRGPTLAEYQVMAVTRDGLESFLGEPVRVVAEASQSIVRPGGALESRYAGASAGGYLPLMIDRNTAIDLPLTVGTAGDYAIDVRYANGNGPVNTDAKAAVRTLTVDGRQVGVLVMPQRGRDLWTDWGYSNPVRVRLAAGAHVVRLTYTPLDANMNGTVSTALLDHLRATRLEAVAR